MKRKANGKEQKDLEVNPDAYGNLYDGNSKYWGKYELLLNVVFPG